MTTMSTMAADRLPWWRYVGPWPLRPGAMFFIIMVLSISTTVSSIRVSNIAQYGLAAILVSATAAGTLWLFQRFTPIWSQRTLGYIVAVATATAVGTTFRGITDTWVLFESVSLIANIVLVWFRGLILAIISLAILGVSSRRLQRQVQRTEQALSIVREQADELLRADELVRQQVASLLHDRVQAGLIAVCLHLQDIGARVPDAERQSIREIVDSLERIRSLDVRRAVRSLSPNLAEVDFESALRELAEFYEPTITTDINLDMSESSAFDIRLGTYRIIEQALLNAAGHGGAHRCVIDVRETDGQLHLDVYNDGNPLPTDVSPGFGSTLTSTWCRTLGGTWHRVNGEGRGVHLRASLPLQPGVPLTNFLPSDAV